MFTKRTTKSAIIGLLIATSCQIFMNEASAVQLNVISGSNSQVEAKVDPVSANEVNPDFASSMTNNHWKLYGPEETFDMYKRAEYKKNEQKHKVQVYKAATAAA